MKRRLSAEEINRIADDPAHRTRTDLSPRVDPTLPWVPEDWTQLWYTPLYASLHREHRLRYNQLFGLRINEYVMMLESDLIERILPPLRRHPSIAGDPAVVRALDDMIDEERRHYSGFARLNRICRPDLYPEGRDRLFSRLPPWGEAMMRFTGLVAGRLGFSLWYLMALEESAQSFARALVRTPETPTLGRLDQGFTSVHREHMKDEARHLHVDQILIERTIEKASPRRRRLEAGLFRAMLVGITRPTRGGAGVRVIRQLVRDMPELQMREEELIRAVLALRNDRPYQESLFNRRINPMTFAVFDCFPELDRLGERMLGYDRRPS